MAKNYFSWWEYQNEVPITQVYKNLWAIWHRGRLTLAASLQEQGGTAGGTQAGAELGHVPPVLPQHWALCPPLPPKKINAIAPPASPSNPIARSTTRG